MTETKEDIQAQIDQLDAKWKKKRNRYKTIPVHHLHVVGLKKILPRAAYNSHSARLPWYLLGLILYVLTGLALYFDYIEDEKVNATESWALLIASVISTLHMFNISRNYQRKLDAYTEAKSAFEGNRADLVEQLDALD